MTILLAKMCPALCLVSHTRIQGPSWNLPFIFFMEKLNHRNFEGEKKNQMHFKAGASENTSLKECGGPEFKSQKPSRKPDGVARICNSSIPATRWEAEAEEWQGVCRSARLEDITQKPDLAGLDQ